MRGLSSLITLALIAAVIAAFTVPSNAKFQKFINEKYADSVHLRPIMGDTSTYRLLSIALFTKNSVGFADSGNERNRSMDTTGLRKPSFNIQHIRFTERYMGLFGTFWKIKPKKD